MGLDKNVDEEEGLKRRVTRRGGEEEGFLGWKVCPFFFFFFSKRGGLMG